MIYVKLLLTAFFWGGTFIAGKFVAGGVNPYCTAFIRFAVAAVLLVFITLKHERKPPSLDAGLIINVLLLGLTGVFLYNLFFFTGLKHIDAGRASLIIALNPVMITVFSALFYGESIGALKTAGIALSVTGALIVISHGDPAFLTHLTAGKGEMLIFGCVLSWVSYSLIGKKVMNRLSPLASVCSSSIAGALLLFIPALNHGLLTDCLHYTPGEWASMFYLGIFGTVLGFTWYYDGIKRIGPVRAGIFINFVPVSAIALAYVFLGETITGSGMLGALLVITGVCLTNRQPPPKEKLSPPPERADREYPLKLLNHEWTRIITTMVQ